MPFNRPHLRIGVSARIYYPAAPVLDLGGVWTKTLHYLEQSVAHWLLRGGALPMMIPAVDSQSLTNRTDFNLRSYADSLDGLVLQGGNDVSPHSYGEQPLNPAWAGDAVRDRYEIELINAFIDAGKPVFGICRGLQVLNVAFGGTLLQDIATQRPEACAHVRPRPLRTQPACDGDRARHAPGRPVPGAQQRHHQQHPPPGHQGPGAGLRGRGALPAGRHHRSRAPARPALCCRGAVAPGIPSAGRPGGVRRRTLAQRLLAGGARRRGGLNHEQLADLQPRRRQPRHHPARRRRGFGGRQGHRGPRGTAGLGGAADGAAAGRGAALSRRGGGADRGPGRHDDARDGQADLAVEERAHRAAAAAGLLSGTGRRRGARRTCLRRRRHARADQPCAAGRGGQHLGLELPLVRGLQRHRAGAADRQRRALQTQRTCHAHRPGASPGCCTRPACRPM